MRQSQFFTKTTKEAPADEKSVNAQLLIRGGFVHKEMAGAYSYLPLGFRVLNKICNIIRQEMNDAGGQEIFMTALQEKEVWEKTGRWSDDVVDNWFKTNLKSGAELGLGFTHEEAIARIMKNHIFSYKDLPFCAYQIQTKFRNEARAKAGLIRGREFLMKDLYDFSRSKEEHGAFYEKMKGVYMKVFARLGMGDKTYITISSGGSFSKYSYEFQTLSPAGEDTIYIIDEEKKLAINKADYNGELASDFNIETDKDNLKEEKSIEVGDIYSLGYKYSEAFNLVFQNEKGESEFVYMGSYGMSPSRLMGTIVEIHNDSKGIVWPEDVAPFKVHLIALFPKDGEGAKKVKDEAEKLYYGLEEKGVEVLYDDRGDKSAGEKFADADLIGIPYRLVISGKTIEKGSVEIKRRDKDEISFVNLSEVGEKFKSKI
jgi:prolyl-tRNA synthetase